MYMVIKMYINKTHYKVMDEPKKIYVDLSSLELREKLNVAFKKPTAEDDMTGIFGKYDKLDKMYKLKYIYTRNKQLQPLTFDRFHYLVDIGEDANGTFIEYVMVYDKLFDPLIRLVYIFAVCAIIGYLFYLFKNGAMSKFSAAFLSGLICLSVALVFKKAKESAEECKKAEILFKKLVSEIQ